MPIRIRNATLDDLPAILEIYNDSVLNSTATFENIPQTLEQRKPWFEKHQSENYPLVVAENHSVIGYSSLSPFRNEEGYKSTVELSVYVSKNSRRNGIATLLMNGIVNRARKIGYHTIVSCIAGSNEPSIKLHEKLGFELSGRLKEVGFKFGAWQDDVFYLKILDM
ncbi:MAG: GNAT family N-acetyltransferase [Nitrososphaerales archaeon]